MIVNAWDLHVKFCESYLYDKNKSAIVINEITHSLDSYQMPNGIYP